jgi:hypothetical protein
MDLCIEYKIYDHVSQLLNEITNLILSHTNNQKFKNIYYQVVKWYIFNIGIDNNKECCILSINNDYSQLYKDIYNTADAELSESLKQMMNKLVILANNKIRETKNGSFGQNYTIDYITGDLVFESGDIKHKIDLNEPLYEKLKNTYNGLDNMFHETVFVIMLRYSLFGHKKETISLSVNFVYDNPLILNKVKLDVELFGSPINRNLDKFCSLYPDVEQHFGSIGSFFHLDNKHWYENKYFVANPPYDEHIMEQMAIKIINILDNFKECCFIVTIPDWRPNEKIDFGKYKSYETYDLLCKSNYLKIHKIYSSAFEYTNYFRSLKMKIGNTGTIILVLSNFNTPLKESDF